MLGGRVSLLLDVFSFVHRSKQDPTPACLTFSPPLMFLSMFHCPSQTPPKCILNQVLWWSTWINSYRYPRPVRWKVSAPIEIRHSTDSICVKSSTKEEKPCRIFAAEYSIVHLSFLKYSWLLNLNAYESILQVSHSFSMHHNIEIYELCSTCWSTKETINAFEVPLRFNIPLYCM